MDANSGGITCTLLGPGAESFKLAINSDANGVLVYSKRMLRLERSNRPFSMVCVDLFKTVI